MVYMADIFPVVIPAPIRTFHQGIRPGVTHKQQSRIRGLLRLGMDAGAQENQGDPYRME
jgi:hypothetical protein